MKHIFIKIVLVAMGMGAFLTLGLIIWPGPTLALLFVGLPISLLGKVWYDLHWETKTYGDEHDLP